MKTAGKIEKMCGSELPQKVTVSDNTFCVKIDKVFVCSYEALKDGAKLAVLCLLRLPRLPLLLSVLEKPGPVNINK